MTADQLTYLFELLDQKYGHVETFLHHRNTYELLVAVILSAQTTDVLVNKITRALFERYPDLVSLAQASYDDVARLIAAVNYYQNKAKFIINMAQMVHDDFNGVIPHTIEELIKLPGVGRKVANVLMAEEFGITDGFVVDTHVKRVTFRLGLTEHFSPEKVERDLMAIIPKERWQNMPRQLILIGRQYCFGGRPPNCTECPLRSICPKKI